jgi:thiosulfate/3-mercaptopyruvate sulfurtransferase
MKSPRYLAPLLAAAFVFLSAPPGGGGGRALAAEVVLPGPLVTPQWLREHGQGVTVIDVGSDAQRLTTPPQFTTDAQTGAKALARTGGHIPGALFVDFNAIRQERDVGGVKLAAMMPERSFFERAMRSAGLDKGRAIVIAAVGESVESLDMAARLLFQLKYFGQEQVALLNGGTNAWIDAGYPVSTDPVPARQGNWAAGAERKELLATAADVQASLGGGAVQLIDARPVAQFFGIAKSPAVTAAGHVQGARSLPPEGLTAGAGPARVYLDGKQLRAVFALQGIDADKPSISYCNTGQYAAGAWFAAHEILGQKGARLYAGSMSEWTHLNHPVVGLPQ